MRAWDSKGMPGNSVAKRQDVHRAFWESRKTGMIQGQNI